jgi:hypothetical protein
MRGTCRGFRCAAPSRVILVANLPLIKMLSIQRPYLKALLWARPITVAGQTPCGRLGDTPRLSRPSAPEGGAQGRRTVPRSVLGSSVSLPTGCRASGAGVIGTLASPSVRHAGVPEGCRNQIPSVARSWALRAGPSVDDAGRAAGSRVRFPLGQDPIGGFGHVARDRTDRCRVPLPLLDARSEATDVPAAGWGACDGRYSQPRRRPTCGSD